MELREAKQELKDYLSNKRYIESKLEEVECLTEQINKVTATYSDMPKATSGNGKEELIVKKLDTEREIYKYLLELTEQKRQIEQTLRKLEARYRNVLDFIYIKGMRQIDVAAKEGYSHRQLQRVLRAAYKAYAQERGNK